MNGGGSFTISLDVELYWGLRDVVALDAVRARLLGDRAVVPRLLDRFERYGVRATWATVGFLFFEGREDLRASLPDEIPRYTNRKFDPYLALDDLGDSEKDDPFHFAPSLLREIASRGSQEIGTHTFSHYYCLEEGQTASAFASDLRAAVRAAERLGVRVESLVFPRNQMNDSYLSICKKAGILAYRGNPRSWMYEAETDQGSLSRRGARLLDAYINVSGLQSYAPERSFLRRSDVAGERQPPATSEVPINVPASRFLRPYSRRLRAIYPLQLRRITSEMTSAAKRGRLYHLWWHPHNFGVDQEANLAALEHILGHYMKLREKYGMSSRTMGEVARHWQAAADVA